MQRKMTLFLAEKKEKLLRDLCSLCDKFSRRKQNRLLQQETPDTGDFYAFRNIFSSCHTTHTTVPSNICPVYHPDKGIPFSGIRATAGIAGRMVALADTRRIDLGINMEQQIISFCLAILDALHDILIQYHADITLSQQIGLFS